MVKPPGWWAMHPTLRSLAAPRTRDSNGDEFGDFAGNRQDIHRLSDIGISGPLLKQKMLFPCNPLG